MSPSSRCAIRLLRGFVLATLLAACAPQAVREAPPLASGAMPPAVVSARLPASEQKLAQYDVPGSAFGVSHLDSRHLANRVLFLSGGGTSDAGSVAARGDPEINAVLDLPLADLLRAHAGGAAALGRHFELTPAANLLVPPGGKWLSGFCMVWARLDGGSTAAPWTAVYRSHLDAPLERGTGDLAARAREALSHCLAQAHALFTAHVAGRLPSTGPRQEIELVRGDSYYGPVSRLAGDSGVELHDALGLLRFSAASVARVRPAG